MWVVRLEVCMFEVLAGADPFADVRAASPRQTRGRFHRGETLCGERSEQQESIGTVGFEAAIGVRTAGSEEGIRGGAWVEGRTGGGSSDLAPRAR